MLRSLRCRPGNRRYTAFGNASGDPKGCGDHSRGGGYATVGPVLSGFSSLRVPQATFPIINLQQGEPAVGWGRIIFHVSDVDAFWNLLERNGFSPTTPQDAAWGERYFHF